MIKPLKVPRGVAVLFSLGNRYDVKISQDWSHRSDKVLETMNLKSLKYEIMDNYISNASPMTLNKGNPYVIVDKFFGGIFYNG